MVVVRAYPGPRGIIRKCAGHVISNCHGDGDSFFAVPETQPFSVAVQLVVNR